MVYYGRRNRMVRRNRRVNRKVRKINRYSRGYSKTNPLRIQNIKNPRFGGFPTGMRTHLRYNELVSINPAAGATLASYVFRANSIYDPNRTGIGHQPLGRDIWAGIYNHYVVISSKITCMFIPTIGKTGTVIYGTYLDDDANITSTTYTDLVERKKTSYRYVNVATLDYIKPCEAYYSAQKWFGIKDIGDNNTRLGAAIGSTPAEECMFHCFLQDTSNAGLDVDSHQFSVIIEYYVEFTELQDQTQN